MLMRGQWERLPFTVWKDDAKDWLGGSGRAPGGAGLVKYRPQRFWLSIGDVWGLGWRYEDTIKNRWQRSICLSWIWEVCFTFSFDCCSISRLRFDWTGSRNICTFFLVLVFIYLEVPKGQVLPFTGCQLSCQWHVCTINCTIHNCCYLRCVVLIVLS